MDRTQSALAALYGDPALAAYGFALAGSVAGAEQLVRAGVTHVASRRWRPGSWSAAAVRARMVAVHCDTLRDGRESQSSDDEGEAPGFTATDRAIAALDPWVRTAMVLRYRDEFPVAAVAKALGRTKADVDVLLTRGREELAAALGVSSAAVDRVAVGEVST